MSQSLIAICPKCKHKEVYEGTAKRPRIHCETCKYRYYIETQKTQKEKIKKKVKGHISSNSDTKKLAHIIESVENPVAFASAHIFKKMIETGDVRWAQLFVSVLDKTNKLDYETSREQEWLKQASNMSMDDLVSKIAVKGSISKNILRRLEEAEDTSLYDNL
jgi:ribosomal protein S25